MSQSHRARFDIIETFFPYLYLFPISSYGVLIFTDGQPAPFLSSSPLLLFSPLAKLCLTKLNLRNLCLTKLCPTKLNLRSSVLQSSILESSVLQSSILESSVLQSSVLHSSVSQSSLLQSSVLQSSVSPIASPSPSASFLVSC